MPSSFTIRPVQSRADRKRFINFPYELYRETPYWIPPLRMDQAHILNPKKNAFFEHGQIRLFLAVSRGGKVVGRIAAIVNGQHLKKYEDGVGFFGFFDCVEDYAIAEALFDVARDWLREQGLTAMRGPTNPSMNDTAGLLVGGFDQYPAVLMPYNFPYYEDFLLQYGFTRAMTMWAYYIHYKYAQLDRLERGIKLIYRRYPELKLRTIDMGRFEEEARTLMHIYNDAWSDNWGHVPMTEAEFQQLGKQMKQIINPKTIFILEYKGQPVAFTATIPDMNHALKHVKDGRLLPFGLFKLIGRAQFGGLTTGRTALMGVLREHQGKGFDVIVNHAIVGGAPEHGFEASEMSWILDSNPRMKNAAEGLGGIQDKEYALFEWNASDAEPA